MKQAKEDYLSMITKEILKPAAWGVFLLFLLFCAARATASNPMHTTDQASMRLLNAIYENKPDLVLSLLDRGANVNSHDFGGVTALMFSMYNENDAISDMLLTQGADINAIDRAGKSVLMHALLAGRNDFILEHLDKFGEIDHATENGFTALILASQDEDLELVKALVGAGANIHHKTRRSTTALMHATAYGNFYVADFLLTKGADVNHQSQDGTTALHMAAYYGHNEITGLLIDWWADLELRDANGNTPLMVAVYGRQLGTTWYLLESGANAEAVNNAGLSVLGVATANDDLEMIEHILGYMSAQAVEEDKRMSAMAIAMFSRNQPLARKLQSHEFVEPRGLYFSEIMFSQGFDFNGDDNFYHSSLGLYEARYQLVMRLQFLARPDHRKVLADQGDGFFNQVHERRNTFALGIYREVTLARLSPSVRFGVMPGLEMAFTQASYRGTSMEPPGGLRIVPAAEMFLHLRSLTFYGGYNFFDTGQPVIAPHRFRAGVAYRLPLYRKNQLRYFSVLRYYPLADRNYQWGYSLIDERPRELKPIIRKPDTSVH